MYTNCIMSEIVTTTTGMGLSGGLAVRFWYGVTTVILG